MICHDKSMVNLKNYTYLFFLSICLKENTEYNRFIQPELKRKIRPKRLILTIRLMIMKESILPIERKLFQIIGYCVNLEQFSQFKDRRYNNDQTNTLY